MKIAFTICSNNYLAQAKILCDSLLENNPNYKVVIGLCDELSDSIDYSFFNNIEIINVSKIDIFCFEEIINKYNIIELNTSIKPSFFKYFIKMYPELETIIYFDPDIQIFSSLSGIEKYLEQDDILITPHILMPTPVDDLSPSENLFLNYGIYNLGFIALNPRSKNSLALLNWWEERTLKIGFDRVCSGLFVDQLWINLVTIFFSKVKVVMEYGYNVAPWNLHERNNIIRRGKEFLMEDDSKLSFFHFSSYNYKTPDIMSKHYNRYDEVSLSKEVRELYSQYHNRLLNNKIEEFSQIKCFFIKEVKQVKVKNENLLVIFKKNLLPPFIFKIYNKIK